VGAAAPPGVDPAAFGLALVEDSCDLVASLELVAPAVAVSDGAEEELAGRDVGELVWPGTPVLRLGPPDGQGVIVQTLQALAALGARQAAVLAADAPDLPPLLVGKLFRALGGADRQADIAVCPAEGGGLVALAAWLPVAEWFIGVVSGMERPDAPAELDVADMLSLLRRAAPRRGLVQAVPGWHRLRSVEDLGRLDPGLEGWQATRGLLRSGG
jgi:hypothetical protein